MLAAGAEADAVEGLGDSAAALRVIDFGEAERCVSFSFSIGAQRSRNQGTAQAFLAQIPVIPGSAELIPD